MSLLPTEERFKPSPEVTMERGRERNEVSDRTRMTLSIYTSMRGIGRAAPTPRPKSSTHNLVSL
jgi:hypothetical protein